MIVTSTRDKILQPFTQFKQIPWPHKISRGFVRVYQTDLDAQQAREFVERLGYVFNRESEKAFSYTKVVGRFTVDAVYNRNDGSLLVAGERKR